MKAMLPVLVPFFLVAAGLFSAICAWKEVPFFMNNRRAQTMIRLIGWTGTRIFYITLGIALVVAGAMFIIHGVPAEG